MKLLAVIVIFKMQPSESPTFQSLILSRNLSNRTPAEMSILVWDNTPNGQNPGDLPSDIRYVSAPHNPGLSPAYNHAMRVAQDEGFEWLVTLDQDTILPENFLARIADIAEQLKDDKTVAAILPQIVGSKKRISPFRFVLKALPLAIPHGFVGVPAGPIYGVNSAATLRVESLQRIDGYNPFFPLDISDLDLFHRLSLAGMSVYVAGDVIVPHDFSLLNKRGRMSLQRYRNLLRDECAFWDTSMSGLGRTERMIRLAGRVCKDLLRPGTLEFQRITCGEIFRRLATRRARRIEEWRDWAGTRLDSATHNSATLSLPVELR